MQGPRGAGSERYGRWKARRIDCKGAAGKRSGRMPRVYKLDNLPLESLPCTEDVVFLLSSAYAVEIINNKLEAFMDFYKHKHIPLP